jgi:hypothetical protein
MKKLFLSSDWDAVKLVATWWVAINAFAYIVANRLNMGADTAYLWLQTFLFPLAHSWNPVPMYVQWDSGWYLSIVEHGYALHAPGEFANLVFFPLYPLLTKIAGVVLLGNYGMAGWLVSSTALVGACVVFSRLVREFHPGVDARLVLVFLLLFPTAFFLNAVYTESLFLLLSVASIYNARKERWWVAGVIGIFAALTRVTGILLVLPLAWEYARANDFNLRKMARVDALAAGLPALGTLAFFLFHYVVFDNFLIFFELQRAWGRAFTFNPDHFHFLSHPAITNFGLDIFFVALGLVASIYMAWRVRASYGLYMLATIGVALATGTTVSIGRYILVLFPMYIAFASIKSEYIRWGWLFFSGLLFALYTILFVHGHWAG